MKWTLLALFLFPKIVFAEFSATENRLPTIYDVTEVDLKFRNGSIMARSAAQVSQLADQAQLSYSRMLISQNIRIIELLEKIANVENSENRIALDMEKQLKGLGRQTEKAINKIESAGESTSSEPEVPEKDIDLRESMHNSISKPSLKEILGR